jgi:hypothetical protein
MKSLLLTLTYFLILGITTLHAQIPQISVKRNATGATQYFTTLQDAYTYAIDDDVITLPGGVFSFAGDTLKKRLHILGAGIRPDTCIVTGKTIITTSGGLYINSSGSNSIIEGLMLMPSGHIFCINNKITFINCLVQNVIYNLNNGFIKNTVLLGYLSNCKNSIIENTVMQALWNDTNINVANSIIMQEVALCQTVNIKNSIFAGQPQHNLFPNINTYFYNSMTTQSILNPNVNQYNCFANNTALSEVFMESSSSFWYTDLYNYELKPTCIAKNAGTDGTDLGIYGGLNPCPKGWKPSNPHYQKGDVNTQTNVDGTLNIKFKVEAQK